MCNLIARVRLAALFFPLLVTVLLSARTDNLDAVAEAQSKPLVMLYFYPLQEHMEGPNPDLNLSYPGISPVGYLVSPTAWGIGLAIDIARTYNAYRKHNYIEEPLSELESFDFDFEAETTRRLEDLDRDANWQVLEIEELDFVGKQKNRSKRIFRKTDARYALYVKTVYFVSPDLAQIRVLLTAALFRRTQHESVVDRMMTRNYQYLSRSRGDLMRPWHEGEKEKVIRKLEELYGTSIAEDPENAAEIAEERDNIVDQVRKRDVILPFIAIAEGWPGDTMEQELQVGADAVFGMLSTDLRDINPRFDKDGKRLKFVALDPVGKSTKLKGYAVESGGPNSIFRIKNGDMYSVPPQ